MPSESWTTSGNQYTNVFPGTPAEHNTGIIDHAKCFGFLSVGAVDAIFGNEISVVPSGLELGIFSVNNVHSTTVSRPMSVAPNVDYEIKSQRSNDAIYT